MTRPALHAPASPVDMVLVGGEYRPVGVISSEEMQELERAHEDGDIRAEVTLRLLREGRPAPTRR